MPIGGPKPDPSALPSSNGGGQYQPMAQQPYHPGYQQQQQQPVWGQPIYASGNDNNNSSPIPPPPQKAAAMGQQQQQQGFGYSGEAPPPFAYPAMPSDTTAPVADFQSSNSAPQHHWQDLRLDFPMGPNGSPIGFPTPPTADSRWKLQEGNVKDDVLENRICQNIKLIDVELRNCYVVNCTVRDATAKGGYFSGCKLTDCEFQNTSCVISCAVEDATFKFCGITNTVINDGDLQKCNVLDSKVTDANVFGGSAIRCMFRKCGVSEHTFQEHCNVSECTSSARQNV